MTTTKKSAAKAAQANQVANANEVSKSKTTKRTTKGGKGKKSNSKELEKPQQQVVEQPNNEVVNTLTQTAQSAETTNIVSDDVCKADKKLDRSLRSKAAKSALIAKHSLASLPAWQRELKNSLAKVDAELAEQVENKWAKVLVNFKRSLDYVVVVTEGTDKKTSEKVTKRSFVNVVWVRKTDKVGLPQYFANSKVDAYRFNDKKGVGKEIAISDSKELEVTRSVKSPVMILATDTEGNQYPIHKKVATTEGGWKYEYEDIDVIYVPLEKLDFDFKEIKNAWQEALVATFGSKAVK